jgi:CPA2 family monovalent cation:H+ antiporter-2
MTGIIAGPHLLALIGSEADIELLAEIGVVFLLFTIGMEFSLKHLLRIRRIVFLGGLMQVSLTAALFYLASRFYDLNWQSGIFIGFLAALSSSALVLKLLQERSELTSNYGRTVLGILIFQDILLVPLLLFTNLLGNDTMDITTEVLLLVFKAALIIGLVYAGNKWLLPKLLHHIAMSRNQELFMMSIFLICFGIALITYELGMSLAFGAFLAGLMISESEYSHHAFGNLIPIKDTFTSFFFVSIGMLLDLHFVTENIMLIVVSVLLVIVLKTVIAGATGFVLGHTFRGTVVIGLALSQVGEFSFVLAKMGLDYAILSGFYYQLFLAVTVLTMGLTPLLMNVSVPFANTLMKLPLPKRLVEGMFPLSEIKIPDYRNHIVIIGMDASALMLSLMAKHYGIQHVSIIFDPAIAKEKLTRGDMTVYGDAVNEPILLKAHVDKADIVVVSVGNMITAMAITEKVDSLNHNAHIIVRAKQIQNVEHFYRLGADQVFPEKLENAISLFHRVLAKQLWPQREIQRMLSHIRSMNLGAFMDRDIINRPSILDELSNVTISAIEVEKGADISRMSLQETELRKKTGVTLLAIKRGSEVIEHPGPDTVLKEGDTGYVLGDPEQINLAAELFSNSANIT